MPTVSSTRQSLAHRLRQTRALFMGGGSSDPPRMSSTIRATVPPTGERDTMKFTVKIDCDNAAFGFQEGVEVARILRDLADSVEDGGNWFPLLDVNGNRVGEAQYTGKNRTRHA